jgi:hypothetical protein
MVLQNLITMENSKTSGITENIQINKEENKMPLADKITYAFCILGALYFIGRFIAGVAFNI